MANLSKLYTNETIKNFARVFTGFDYVGGEKTSKSTNLTSPMAVNSSDHDTGSKTLLAFGTNTNLPAGQSAEQDLDDAIDNIMDHPNVGPFISKLLIQRLVTSNPSQAYVKSVAQVFNNNGSGVKGDLSAVIKEVFMHNEARQDLSSNNDKRKIQETFLSFMALVRGLNITTTHSSGYLLPESIYGDSLGMSPFTSPSVFNFYAVDYQPYGIDPLVAPEMGVLNTTVAVAMPNTFRDFLGGVKGGGNLYEIPEKQFTGHSHTISLDFSYELSILTSDPNNPNVANERLLDYLTLILTPEYIRPSTRTIILNAMNAQTDANERLNTAVYLLSVSPEFHTLQ